MSAEVSASNPRKRVAPSEEAFPVEKSEAGEDRLRRVLDNHERRGYVSAPTPIERMPGLSEAVGGGTQLFVKRDDLLPLAGGGSKTRKLDYLIQQALDEGAATLVTCGAVQSNHSRLTASAAAREGLGCYLVLEERVPGSYTEDAGGNNYTFKLLGAHTQLVPLGGVDPAKDSLLERLRSEGLKPYFIPGGGSNALGSIGYARCALEILDYTKANGSFDAIVTCSGSGGTHAGLLTGLRGACDNTPVFGISVRFDEKTQKARIEKLHAACAKHCGLDADPADTLIIDSCVGAGYSLPTEGMKEAVKLFARREGILLDPVYTGKGAAGLLSLCRDGGALQGKRVLFIHTGGAPSLFHYMPLETAG